MSKYSFRWSPSNIQACSLRRALLSPPVKGITPAGCAISGSSGCGGCDGGSGNNGDDVDAREDLRGGVGVVVEEMGAGGAVGWLQ